MTNVRLSDLRVKRSDVIQDSELAEAISNADKLPLEFFRLRAKATLSLARLSGKRRGELAMLPLSSIKVVRPYLNVDWVLEKKRTEITLNKMSHKSYPLSDPLIKHILIWLIYLKKNYPTCQYFLPHCKDVFGMLVVYPSKPVCGKTVFNIIRGCSESIWPHLNRESVAADIIKRDNTIAGIYAVQEALDLDPATGFQTASRYARRYGRQIVQRQSDSTST